MLRRILYGLSCRDYRVAAEAVPEAFGLSRSSVSRRYIRVTARHLAALQERRLERYDVVALVLDGKRFAEDTMVIALGITLRGEKVLLGFVQTGTENAAVCATFLRGLLDRGLRVTDGLLVVIDGGKGLRRAVHDVFGEQALVQRCVWHKRENVVDHLPQRLQPASITSYFRRALVGTVHDPGLRITFDTDIRYRFTDLDLASRNPGRHMIHPERVVLEVKANERIPRWLASLVGEFNAQIIRISKYCQSIEVAGRVPRSVFHIPQT